jgi:hypothetical protein
MVTLGRLAGRLPISAVGHKRTSAHVRIMSALPLKADILTSRRLLRAGTTDHCEAVSLDHAMTGAVFSPAQAGGI